MTAFVLVLVLVFVMPPLMVVIYVQGVRDANRRHERSRGRAYVTVDLEAIDARIAEHNRRGAEEARFQ